MINENLIKGKWNEVKGDIRRVWDRAVEDEIGRPQM